MQKLLYIRILSLSLSGVFILIFPVQFSELHVFSLFRTSASTPSLRTMSNVLFNAPDSQIHQESLPSARITDGEAAVTKATNIPVPKRTRSPPLSSTDQVFQGDYYSAQDDIER